MAVKASETFKVYENPKGPKISTVSRNVIEKNKLYFKDIDGSGKLSKVNDWRIPAAERAEAYVKKLTLDEKIGQLFISDWGMDGEESKELKEWFIRHVILRKNATVEDLIEYLNKLQEAAESSGHFVPVQVASNSCGEYGKELFSRDDIGSVLPTWPGALGIASAAMGDSIKVVDQYAEAVRRSWNAVGLRKGYLYTTDVVTAPCCQQASATFGEDSKFVKKAINHMIPRVQGGKDNVTADGVAIAEKLISGDVVSKDGKKADGLDGVERIAFSVNNEGINVVSDIIDINNAKEAYKRSTNDYYEKNCIPQGFTKEEIVITEEALDAAVTRALTEMFELGMFEDTYRDVEAAKKLLAAPKDWDNAYAAHLKSVAVLKNDWVLPLTPEATWQKNVYVEVFHKDTQMAEKLTYELRTMLPQINQVYNPKDADYALLMLYPVSNATEGCLELDICDTTLTGLERVKYISETVHANEGKVIMNVNFTLPWIVRGIEPYADALTASFNTYPQAVLDVIRGLYSPTGKLPFTLPRGKEVLAVKEDGKCVSRNDVPGYNKDKYMPDEMKDENGKAYAYRDGHGNYYELNFGLGW